MIKLLIGGSPCTYWSIAQKNNRETEPSEIKTAQQAYEICAEIVKEAEEQ